MQHLKQSPVGTWKAGPFMDQTSGTGTVTNLTITPNLVRLTKNGANMAAKNHAGTGAHDESGFYDIVFDATDTNTLGRLRALIHTGALPVWDDFEVMAATKYDWLYGAGTLNVGTADAVLSIPAITSGTVGLAIQVNSGTVDRSVSAGTIDRANSIPDPSAGTIGLAVQVNSGTVDAALNASNPSGGTVDLAIQVNSGTVDAALNAANPSGGTVDLAVFVGGGTVVASNAASPSGGTVDLAIAVGTADRVNSSPAPSSGTIGLAVQVNTGTVLRAISAGTVDRANSVPAPSTGTIGLAIQVNSGTVDRTSTVGTTERVISIPNPTGGTMDHTITAGTLLQTLARGEPGQGAPAASADAFTKMDYVYKGFRNKKDNDGTNFQLYADDASTVDQKSSVSSDGTTATIGEMTTGA